MFQARGSGRMNEGAQVDESFGWRTKGGRFLAWAAFAVVVALHFMRLTDPDGRWTWGWMMWLDLGGFCLSLLTGQRDFAMGELAVALAGGLSLALPLLAPFGWRVVENSMLLRWALRVMGMLLVVYWTWNLLGIMRSNRVLGVVGTTHGEVFLALWCLGAWLFTAAVVLATQVEREGDGAE